MNPHGTETQPERAGKLKIYKIKDFIRLTPSGEIDIERSKEIVFQLAVAAALNEDHNILLDMRDTSLSTPNIATVMQVAVEFGRYKSAFKGKMANVLPDDEERLRLARQLKALMECQGLRYELFTNFEEAVEWLSDVKVL